MPNKAESKTLNNIEVNRLFNMKKSNIDRQTKIRDGKIKEEYDPMFHNMGVSTTKNKSQIVFGSELDDALRSSNRKSSLLPSSPNDRMAEAKILEGRRNS